jgi:hypothetical protein
MLRIRNLTPWLISNASAEPLGIGHWNFRQPRAQRRRKPNPGSLRHAASIHGRLGGKAKRAQRRRSRVYSPSSSARFSSHGPRAGFAIRPNCPPAKPRAAHSRGQRHTSLVDRRSHGGRGMALGLPNPARLGFGGRHWPIFPQAARISMRGKGGRKKPRRNSTGGAGHRQPLTAKPSVARR